MTLYIYTRASSTQSGLREWWLWDGDSITVDRFYIPWRGVKPLGLTVANLNVTVLCMLVFWVYFMKGLKLPAYSSVSKKYGNIYGFEQNCRKKCCVNNAKINQIPQFGKQSVLHSRWMNPSNSLNTDDCVHSFQTNGVILVEKCTHISTFIGHKLLKLIIARLIWYPELERKLIKINFDPVKRVCSYVMVF